MELAQRARQPRHTIRLKSDSRELDLSLFAPCGLEPSSPVETGTYLLASSGILGTDRTSRTCLGNASSYFEVTHCVSPQPGCMCLHNSCFFGKLQKHRVDVQLRSQGANDYKAHCCCTNLETRVSTYCACVQYISTTNALLPASAVQGFE